MFYFLNKDDLIKSFTV